MLKVTLYVARNYGKSAPMGLAGRPCSEIIYAWRVERCMAGMAEISGGGATASKAVGMWEGAQEDTTRIEIWVPDDTLLEVLPQVKHLAQEIKTTTYQDCVAVTIEPLTAIFI